MPPITGGPRLGLSTPRFQACDPPSVVHARSSSLTGQAGALRRHALPRAFIQEVVFAGRTNASGIAFTYPSVERHSTFSGPGLITRRLDSPACDEALGLAKPLLQSESRDIAMFWADNRFRFVHPTWHKRRRLGGTVTSNSMHWNCATEWTWTCQTTERGQVMLSTGNFSTSGRVGTVLQSASLPRMFASRRGAVSSNGGTPPFLSDGVRNLIEGDGLPVCVFHQSVQGVLAADTGLLVASKGLVW